MRLSVDVLVCVRVCVSVYVCTQYTQYKRANALGKLNVSAVEIKSVHKKVYWGLLHDFAFMESSSLVFFGTHFLFLSLSVSFSHSLCPRSSFIIVGEAMCNTVCLVLCEQRSFERKRAETKFIWINSTKINTVFSFFSHLSIEIKFTRMRIITACIIWKWFKFMLCSTSTIHAHMNAEKL